MEIGRQVEEDEGGRGEVEAGREGGQEGGRELTSAEVDVILCCTETAQVKKPSSSTPLVAMAGIS